MSVSTREEGTLAQRAVSAPSLSFRTVVPEGAKLGVVLVHGYGEHQGRYREVVARWVDKGVAVISYDQRGHGWSEGPRGHCDRFSDYLEDAADILAKFRERTSDLPLFLFGHSFGGLVAASFALTLPHAFKGLALSSPFFGLALEVPAVKRVAGQLFSRILPTLSLPTEISGTDVTHDPAIARLYENDPLVNKVATARWFTETQAAQRDLYARAAQIRLPVVCIQAGADKLVSAATSRTIFDRMGSTDKKFEERAGLFHEILNEPKVGMEIADQFADWMLAHV